MTFIELDRSEIVGALQAMIAERIFVTYDELLSVLPEAEEDVVLLDTVIQELRRKGIAVVADEKAGEELVKKKQKDKASSSRTTGDLERMPADDVLSFYLVEMAREPLLTHEQEIELARQIERGRQAKAAIQETDYTAEECDRLQTQAEAGQRARERLGRANTRLVVSIAKRYRGNGVPFVDLIQNGNVGLMRAVDRYDYRTGNRFSTYATWWIRQAVTRSLANQGRIIRIPVHTGTRMRKMAQVAQRLEKEHGWRPTSREIARQMKETPERVRQLMRWATRPMSLEQPVGKEKDAALGQFIEDEKALRPDEVTDVHLLSETLEELLNELTPREERVLRLRYGLKDGQTRTLKEVAEKFGLSRERIRQIEQEAIAKIRLVAPNHRLQQFLGGEGVANS
jgi:RNA polymerase primary sigma factor